MDLWKAALVASPDSSLLFSSSFSTGVLNQSGLKLAVLGIGWSRLAE